MSSVREYGAAIFSLGLGEVLLVKNSEESGWAFPFSHTTESDIHVVAAASAVRQITGVDIGDKISRTHWIEAEFPQTGALVRLYVALGVRPETTVPQCAAGATAKWHPLRSILPPVNAILRADHSAGAGAAVDAGDDEEEGGSSSGSLVSEAGVAPFLAKLKALLNRHPEWRISQLDPHLTNLIQEALALPLPSIHQQQQQPDPAQQQQPVEGTGQQPEQLQRQPVEGTGQPEGQQREGAAAQAEDARAQPGAGEAQQGEPQPQQQEQQAQPGDAGTSDEAANAVICVKLEEEDGEAAGVSGVGGGQEQVVHEVEAAAVEAAGVVAAGAGGAGGEGEGEGGAAGGGWRGPRPQEHLTEYCRSNELPEPCYSLVVKKSARRPLVTASCILSHLGVQITPDMHVSGGIHAACQTAALAAILWLEGALPADGGEAVRVVPVGWPPLLSEARGEAWEATQTARRAEGARRELDTAREALLLEMDKKRQRLVAEAAELERLMEALRGGGGGGGGTEPDISLLTASLGLGGNAGGSSGAAGGATHAQEASTALGLPLALTPATGRARGAKRGAAGGDGGSVDGSGGLTGLAVGLRALKFRSASDKLGAAVAGAGGGGNGGRGPGGGGGRAPGTKRPREDGQAMGGEAGAAAGSFGAGGTPAKSVVMELKELCDRKRWPQPQYCYKTEAGSSGAAAVVTLPPAAGVGGVSSGPQSNRKRAKEVAAAAAMAQLSALGLK